jgi:alpha-ketoglutarate-dependent taurine dioxygenase
MPIPLRKSDAALGAEILFDLSRPIDDATFGERERLFHDNIIVCFRDQRLTNEQHIGFSRRFGELEIHIVKKYLLPGYPEILLISNVKNEAGEHIGLADAGFTWHSDTSYRRQPSRCSLLYAKEVPHRDGRPLGDTVFANCIAAYEALPEVMKRRLAGLKAVHRYAMRRRIDNSPRPKLTAAQLAETPDIAHPIVRTHPYTGAAGALRHRRRMRRDRIGEWRGNAGGRGARPDRRARCALRPARILLPPSVADRRPRHVGQCQRDAPGDLRLRLAGALSDAPNDGDWLGAVLRGRLKSEVVPIASKTELSVMIRPGDLPARKRNSAVRAKRRSITAAHAEPPALDPVLSGDAALRQIGLASLDHISRNEPAVLAGVDEGIHQMRVGVRRLRATLSAFAKLLPEEHRQWASDELCWLADALGPAQSRRVRDGVAQAGPASLGGSARSGAAPQSRRAASPCGPPYRGECGSIGPLRGIDAASVPLVRRLWLAGRRR